MAQQIYYWRDSSPFAARQYTAGASFLDQYRPPGVQHGRGVRADRCALCNKQWDSHRLLPESERRGLVCPGDWVVFDQQGKPAFSVSPLVFSQMAWTQEQHLERKMKEAQERATAAARNTYSGSYR